MMHPDVERYLAQVRASLRGVSRPEIDEIVLELRSHIAERVESGGNVEQVLNSFGDPRALARMYRTDQVVERAWCDRSPLVILHSLLLLRHRSRGAWVSLTLAALGYAWAFALGGAAIEKILSPHDVGLWREPHRALPRLMIDGPGPAGSRELLGWWIVPLALVACAALVYVTRQFGLWRIRKLQGRTEE